MKCNLSCIHLFIKMFIDGITTIVVVFFNLKYSLDPLGHVQAKVLNHKIDL